MIKIVSNWQGGMKFTSIDERGHETVIDSGPEGVETAGSTPMQLFLASLASCGAMDIVNILNKRRLKIESFRVEIDGVRADKVPKIYTDIAIRYHISGERINQREMDRAVNLSSEKLCSVKAMMKEDIRIKIDYFIE
ncbi:OsmC family protein [bacterium]|nr:OsmC family protein [bacterium]